MTTKTKTDEAYEIMQDIDNNLAPMIVRFAKTHYERGNEKELRRIWGRMQKLITDTHPRPVTEDFE